jgi:glycosyltransferase involved in cell wall biosynthesis
VIAFVLRCDGRKDYIGRSITSAEEMLKADFGSLVIVDDSGDHEYAAWLESNFPAYEVIHHPERMGMAAGVRTALEYAITSGADYVFNTEDDFAFVQRTNVNKMAQLLHCETHLAQLSLKRQSVNTHEREVGGFIATEPERYTDRSCESGKWVEHQVVFSFNPCLIPAHVADEALADPGNGVEAGITDRLLSLGYHFGIYGTIADEPRVAHTGDMRSDGWQI